MVKSLDVTFKQLEYSVTVGSPKKPETRQILRVRRFVRINNLQQTVPHNRMLIYSFQFFDLINYRMSMAYSNQAV